MKLYMTVIQIYKIGKYNSQITLPLVSREPFSFTYFPVFSLLWNTECLGKNDNSINRKWYK